MDVEKTLALIAESQLRAERRADKADQRMDRFDKQLRATADLVKAGMKMVREMREAQKETEYNFNALLASQMRTDEQIRKHDQALLKHEQALLKHEEKFNRLLDILSRKHRNGHS